MEFVRHAVGIALGYFAGSCRLGGNSTFDIMHDLLAVLSVHHLAHRAIAVQLFAVLAKFPAIAARVLDHT